MFCFYVEVGEEWGRVEDISITARFPPYGCGHRADGYGSASVFPQCSIMSGCGTCIVIRGHKDSRTLRLLPLLRFTVSGTGSIQKRNKQYYLRKKR